MRRLKAIAALMVLAAVWLFSAWQLCHVVRTGEIIGGSRRSADWVTFEGNPVAFVFGLAVYLGVVLGLPWALAWWGNWHLFWSKPSFWRWEPRRRIHRR